MSDITDQLDSLSTAIKTADIPEELRSEIILRLEQLKGLTTSPTFLPEFDRLNKYIDWILTLPWNVRTEDILDLNHAREILKTESLNTFP